MTWHGVIQTGDVDDAIATAGNHIMAGHPIHVKRFEHRIGPEEEERLAKGFPIEHEPIEYEVHADIPEPRCPHCGAGKDVMVEVEDVFRVSYKNRGLVRETPEKRLVRAYPSFDGHCHYCGE